MSQRASHLLALAQDAETVADNASREAKVERVEKEAGWMREDRLEARVKVLEQEVANLETQARINEFRKGEIMTWTETKPTKSGWYWWRAFSWDRSPMIRSVVERDDKRIWATLISGQLILVANMGGEWCGPIPEPAN